MKTVRILETNVTPTLPKGMGPGNTPTVVGITVEWSTSAGDTMAPLDWIGITEKGKEYTGNDSHGNSMFWFYCGRPNGKRRVNIPVYSKGENYGGEYEAVLCANDGREVLATSNTVTVAPFVAAAA